MSNSASTAASTKSAGPSGDSWMGGNGQANRLSALNSVVGPGASGPWRDTLTEDQDIGLQLLEAGWRGTHEVRATVAQQGVQTCGGSTASGPAGRKEPAGDVASAHDQNVRCSTIAKLDLFWALLQPPLQAIVGLATIVALFFAIFLGTPFISENTQWAWLWLVFLFFLAFGGQRSGVWRQAADMDSWATCAD